MQLRTIGLVEKGLAIANYINYLITCLSLTMVMLVKNVLKLNCKYKKNIYLFNCTSIRRQA